MGREQWAEPQPDAKHIVLAELGHGGTADVYLAVARGPSGFRKLVVLKTLKTSLQSDPEFREMFLNEARLAARLNHPNIVQTYEVVEQDGVPTIVMEYLEGQPLSTILKRVPRQEFPLAMHLRIICDVLTGLQYAHDLVDFDGAALEVVHRDATPQNVFVTFDGNVKLLDFGIAKLSISSVETQQGIVKGKIRYIAPETILGHAVDRRADVYAVGVMLWEAITGRRRWPPGLPQPALFLRLATGEQAESPGAAARGWPAELDAITLKALAPKPEDRFQTAAEFRDALEKVLRPLEAVSLRDLGTMLAGAFAAGRERMRTVIEEQFRNIDSGGPPSAPHQIPIVASPSMVTGSEMFERPLGNIDLDIEQSRSFAPTGKSLAA